MTDLTCECGHHETLHSTRKCGACACNNYQTASDPQAAILAGIERKKISIAAAIERRKKRWATK